MGASGPTKATEVTRSIKSTVERELWGRAAGRCEFNGCNKPLYLSPVTQERVNIAEKAHIYSFAERGPRGWGPFKTNRKALNEAANLLLVCHDCHKTIDQDKRGERYSAALLTQWKDQHEQRVFTVTGVHPSRKSHVVLYGANIGMQSSNLQPEAAKDALFPDWYPAEENPIELSMVWDGRDRDGDFWEIEQKHLRARFERVVKPLIDAKAPEHLSVFGLAPMPLLMELGALLTDKTQVQVYQLHREPFQTWKWSDQGDDDVFEIRRPQSFAHPPAIILSLSDSIVSTRITSVVGERVSIWEMTVKRPHNDFLKSKKQLSAFRSAARQLLSEIGVAHGRRSPVSVFPAMPVACAIEFGRVRMPKVDNDWIIFDHDKSREMFVKTLELGKAV